MMDALGQDFRGAARTLARRPGLTALAVLTLVLGIGGNTAIFSVVDQVLLRPLPYPGGDHLVAIHENASAYGRMSVSPANWLDWQRQSRTLESIAVWNTASVTMTGVGEPVRLKGQMVSWEFFPLLGVQPLLGRAISEADDRPNVPRTAVLSYQLWQRRFGGDSGVIGRTVQVNDQPVVIIGVMPESFRFMYADNEIWSAYRLDRNQAWRDTAGRFVQSVARVKPGVTIAAAQADMDGISRTLAEAYAFNKLTTTELIPLRTEMTGSVHSSLMLLYAAVGILLAIACVNVANLLFARSASRHREIAIRTALGAGRGAIVRQLLVESVLLSACGGVLGIALARWLLDALIAFAPPDLLRLTGVAIDRPVLLYAIALSVGTGGLVGLLPALTVTRGPAAAVIQTAGSRVTQAPRFREALVVCQVALTVTLLCGAGVLTRTMFALDGANSGFDRRDVLSMDVVLPIRRYNAERTTAFFRDGVAALRRLPGVESAGAANSLPVIGSPRSGTSFARLADGAPPLDSDQPQARIYASNLPAVLVRVVTPGYFHTMHIPVLKGREFVDTDAANPQAGLVVNEALARAFLTERDPLTESLSVFMLAKNPYLPVIGVVGDVSEGSVRDNAQPTIFYNHATSPEIAMTFVIRARRAALLAKPAVGAIRDIDPNLAVTKVQTVETALADSLARERLSAFVVAALASTGLLLVSLGVYALLAFTVGERTKEIGIRIALGARLGQVTQAVVAGGLRLVAAGGIIGIVVSLVALRSFGALLFHVTPYDPLTYVSVAALICGVAAIASFVPARRAARVDPLVALRQD